MPAGVLLCELEGDGEVLLVPARVFRFSVLTVKCSVLEGDKGAVHYLEVDGFL